MVTTDNIHGIENLQTIYEQTYAMRTPGSLDTTSTTHCPNHQVVETLNLHDVLAKTPLTSSTMLTLVNGIYVPIQSNYTPTLVTGETVDSTAVTSSQWVNTMVSEILSLKPSENIVSKNNTIVQNLKKYLPSYPQRILTLPHADISHIKNIVNTLNKQEI